MVMPERDRWGPHHRIEIGCVRRSILDGATPTYTASEFMISYEALSAAVPSSASGTRFADHRSYFTMAFDFSHEALGPEARAEALQFAVDEIRCFVDANPTAKALGRTLRAEGIEDCLITRALRETLDADGRDGTLIERLSGLPATSRAAFAAACAERLHPAYVWYERRSGRGDAAFLRRAMDALWVDSSSDPVVVLAALLSEAESLVPDEDEALVAESVLGQHAAAAVVYALRCRLGGRAVDAEWAARQVYEALDWWVTTRDDVDLNEPGSEHRIRADRLIQDELARQQADLDELHALGDARDHHDVVRILERARQAAPSLFGVPFGP